MLVTGLRPRLRMKIAPCRRAAQCSFTQSATPSLYSHPRELPREADRVAPPLFDMDKTPRLRGRAAVEQRDRRLRRTNYLCEMCQAKGIVTIAVVVDHIVPLSKQGPDTDDNTRNLCTEHDRQVTAEQFGHVYKHPIGEDGWPVG
jgi:5-methylcytosine-specific restriction protein A